MKIPKLTKMSEKKLWSYEDIFGNGENEYVKSLIHYEYAIDYHTHSFYELNIVLNGEGYHYIEQMSCSVEKGCVFLIPPYVKHGYINKKHLNVYHLLIHKDFIDKCFNEFRHSDGFYLLFDTEPYLRAHYHENMFLVLNDTELNMITNDINEIENCISMKNPDIYINAIAKKLLCCLCMMMEKRCNLKAVEAKSNDNVFSMAQCLNYIHQNSSEKLTIEKLAQKLNMSRSTFIRCFTRTCGTSPHQYIKNYRIKKAEEYMQHSDKSHTQIAMECGFYDVSHMRKYVSEADSDT